MMEDVNASDKKGCLIYSLLSVVFMIILLIVTMIWQVFVEYVNGLL